MKCPCPADIAEMKARGFDPLTIAKAEQQLERWGKAQQICRVIEDAFVGVTLGGGVGLQEAQGLDDYADAATCASYRATDEKEDWHRISSEALNRCNSSLSFFDAEGTRFHLPAYLIADLKGEYDLGMAFSLTHLSDHTISQFALLDEKQRSAIRAYLLHIAEEPEYEFDHPHIVRSLNEYWVAPTSV